MYRTEMQTTTGTLEADNPLLLAGLQRAAELADIEVVADKDAATLSLRSAGSGTPHTRLDVAIDLDRVVVSMSQQPSQASWVAIYNLLGHLSGKVPRAADEMQSTSE
jgi:hypothetical protein